MCGAIKTPLAQVKGFRLARLVALPGPSNEGVSSMGLGNGFGALTWPPEAAADWKE